MAGVQKKVKDAVLLLKSFVQSPQNQALARIKTQSYKDFETLCQVDFKALSNGKGLREIRNTFKVLLNYLKKYHEQEEAQDLMVLVERAIHKLDEYHTLTEHEIGKVANTNEYSKLKEFYYSKILAQEVEIEEKKVGIHDLETVQKDRDYDLFYIKQEGGGRFFDKSLIRKIRAASDYSHLQIEDTLLDPVLSYQEIHDFDVQSIARFIFDKNYHKIQDFLQQTFDFRDTVLFMTARKALMALMLAGYEKNSLINAPKKTCMTYFSDFQTYLRNVIQSLDFIQLVSFETTKTEPQHVLVDCILSICATLYTSDLPDHSHFSITKELIDRGKKRKMPKDQPLEKTLLSDKLEDQNDEFSLELEHYVHGPILKVWDFLQDTEQHYVFDAIMQGNIPYTLFDLEIGGFSTSCLRLPCPTQQEFINKVKIIEEFKDFIRGMQIKDKTYKHLLINLQDRTSSKEYPRSIALETFQKEAEFARHIYVLTLPKNTDFYQQKGIYQEIETAKEFIYALKMQIESGEECGFFFPEILKPSLSSHFIERMLKILHEGFFEGKKKLTEDEKKAFIELAYLSIQLKAIEEIKPQTFSLTCKDAIDDGGVSNAVLYCFLLFLKQEQIDERFLHRLLFEIPMMLRERGMIQEDFQRFDITLKAIEKSLKKTTLKELNQLFELDVLKIRII
ncbi:MAG: hypothetical protein K940chlam8_00071 [Chlamydiae bacterium]|nr:hypothetical protein [Chlamydiota bacterium]